jgi:TRAP-type C4-dicarboxylate transport system permease small subunit
MDRLFGRLAYILMVIAGVMMCLMMVHISVDVTMKYFFNMPFDGTVETVSYYYMIGVTYLALSYVELRGQHITVGLFYDHFSPFWKRVSSGFAQICTMIFFSILAYQGWVDAFRSLDIGELVMGSVVLYIWPSRFFLPISFSLVTLVSLLRLLQEVVWNRPVPTTFHELFKGGQPDAGG